MSTISNNSETIFQKGILAIQNKNYADAGKYVTQLMQGPLTPDAVELHVKLEMAKQKYDAAYNSLQFALCLAANDFDNFKNPSTVNKLNKLAVQCRLIINERQNANNLLQTPERACSSPLGNSLNQSTLNSLDSPTAVPVQALCVIS